MNFCTHSFVLIFLPLFFVVYFYAYKFKGIRASKYALLLFSFCFYLFSSVPAFFILLIECIATYMIADISRKHNSKLALGMLISLQVGVLIIFKYLNFFIETINTVIPTSVSTLNIIVPLGISFFTFQQIAYSTRTEELRLSQTLMKLMDLTSMCNFQDLRLYRICRKDSFRIIWMLRLRNIPARMIILMR